MKITRRWFIGLLFLLLSGIVSAQLVTTRGVPRKPAAEGGGGGGVAGPPGLLVAVSNATTSLGISSITTNVTVSGENTVMLWLVDWYPSASTLNTPTWKGSSTGVTLVTNTTWYGADSSPAKVYYLASPSAGSGAAAASWSATADEVNYHVYVLTNCSGFDTPAAKYQASGGSISNSCASATTELMIAYSIMAADAAVPTAHDGQTIYSYCHAIGYHSSVVSTKAGQSGNSTNGFIWAGTDNKGIISVGLKGF